MRPYFSSSEQGKLWVCPRFLLSNLWLELHEKCLLLEEKLHQIRHRVQCNKHPFGKVCPCFRSLGEPLAYYSDGVILAHMLSCCLD